VADLVCWKIQTPRTKLVRCDPNKDTICPRQSAVKAPSL
jgi:hypothetical protein